MNANGINALKIVYKFSMQSFANGLYSFSSQLWYILHDTKFFVIILCKTRFESVHVQDFLFCNVVLSRRALSGSKYHLVACDGFPQADESLLSRARGRQCVPTLLLFRSGAPYSIANS